MTMTGASNGHLREITRRTALGALGAELFGQHMPCFNSALHAQQVRVFRKNVLFFKSR